jgi:ribulose-phosphate 3-epimerase
MGGKISPSIMCVDFIRLEEQVRALEEAGVEYIHVDIMDGRFVPNFTLGPDFVTVLRQITAIPLDFHFMVEEPAQYLDLFPIRPGDIVSVHQEACRHLQRTLQAIRQKGATASVALNPATSISLIEDVLSDIGMVLVMTVNPGFAGQKLVPATLDKIRRLKHFLREKGYENIEVEVDGNVSFENAKKMREHGADIFVAGTSSIFKKGQDIRALTRELRTFIQ